MKKEIYFAGGCFWGVEKYFSMIEGVAETQAGYANGETAAPTYEDVCRRGTGHAEAVKVVYDADKLSLAFLLGMFFEIIDPTALNRQGNDRGVQYRTGIYYTDPTEYDAIRAYIDSIAHRYSAPIVTEVGPLLGFFPAEAYHQNYLDKNPFGYCHIGADKFAYAKSVSPASRYRRKCPEVLKKELSDLQFRVTQENATEKPFSNAYYDHFEKGIYVDITTGEPLFISSDKFESGCGWPSFSRPITPELVKEIDDRSFNMYRTEVRSKTGDAHLGHVFADGPRELGGLRYCINSAALRFIPQEKMAEEGYGEYLSLLEQ